METAETPCHHKPLVDVTCKLGAKGCFADGRCHALVNCENKIVTNADRLRAMTDEELAKTLYNGLDVKYCTNDPVCGELLDTEDGIPEEKCIGCALRWLRQPVKGA